MNFWKDEEKKNQIKYMNLFNVCSKIFLNFGDWKIKKAGEVCGRYDKLTPRVGK